MREGGRGQENVVDLSLLALRCMSVLLVVTLWNDGLWNDGLWNDGCPAVAER